MGLAVILALEPVPAAGVSVAIMADELAPMLKLALEAAAGMAVALMLALALVPAAGVSVTAAGVSVAVGVGVTTPQALNESAVISKGAAINR